MAEQKISKGLIIFGMLLFMLFVTAVAGLTMTIKESFEEPKSNIEKQLSVYNSCLNECVKNSPNQYESIYVNHCKDVCVSYVSNMTIEKVDNRFLCNKYSYSKVQKQYKINCSRVD